MELMKADVVTMSSLEMVEFINATRGEGEAVLRHDSFMAKVPKVLGGGAQNFLGSYLSIQNKELPCYNFPKREACLMAMSYSYELQARVFDRMTELEDANKEPLTLAEITLIHAQRLVSIEREQKRLAQQQAQVAAEHTVIKAQLSALTQGENFKTIVGYANLKKQKVDSPTAARLGKLASKYCRENNIMTGNANHPVYGTCKTYPVEVLESVLPF